jgi:hypothetical protein
MALQIILRRLHGEKCSVIAKDYTMISEGAVRHVGKKTWRDALLTAQLRLIEENFVFEKLKAANEKSDARTRQKRSLGIDALEHCERQTLAGRNDRSHFPARPGGRFMRLFSGSGFS